MPYWKEPTTSPSLPPFLASRRARRRRARRPRASVFAVRRRSSGAETPKRTTFDWIAVAAPGRLVSWNSTKVTSPALPSVALAPIEAADTGAPGDRGAASSVALLASLRRLLLSARMPEATSRGNWPSTDPTSKAAPRPSIAVA